MSKKNWIITGIVGFLFLFIVMPGCVALKSYNNLVTLVKGYAKHEKSLFEEVTRLRSQWGAAKSADQKVAASQGLEGALSRLMVVVERYPELKRKQNFLKLGRGQSSDTRI